MSFMKTILGSAAAAALSATAALADPAIIFDLGGKFDKSFNEAAFQGAQRWADETGGSFREIELQNEAQREQALRRFAEAGSNPIVMAGFAFADALSKVALDYPDTKFAVIDVNWLSMPNVRGIGFNEHEGSYLVGMLAAQASATGTVGFVGGMDIPLIRRFGCGFAQGVKAAIIAAASTAVSIRGSRQRGRAPAASQHTRTHARARAGTFFESPNASPSTPALEFRRMVTRRIGRELVDMPLEQSEVARLRRTTSHGQSNGYPVWSPVCGKAPTVGASAAQQEATQQNHLVVQAPGRFQLTFASASAPHSPTPRAAAEPQPRRPTPEMVEEEICIKHIP